MSVLTNRVTTEHSSRAAGTVGGFAATEPAGQPTPGALQEGPTGRQAGIGVSGYGIFAGIMAAILPIAISPSVASIEFSLKFALMLLFAGVGLVPLLRLAVRSRIAWPARLLLAFLAVGLISALTSQAPNVGLFGLYLWGTGWLFWLSCAGALAIGSQLHDRDLDWLFGGLVVGAAANALMAIYQIVWQPTSGTFGPYAPNQADGLLGNPVQLEALLLGVIALVAVRLLTRGRFRWHDRSLSRLGFAASFVFLVLCGVALEFTAERLAVVLLAALFVFLLAVGRERAVGVILAIAAGYAIGYAGGGSGLGTRVAQGTSATTVGNRLSFWQIAMHAVAHHPLIGAGPGEVLGATAPLMTRSLSIDIGAGRLFADSHDIFVEVAVTTGLVGLVLFLGFLGSSLLAAWRAGSTFALAALGIFAVELVEPLNVAVTCLAFLCLGAATMPASVVTAVTIERPSTGDEFMTAPISPFVLSRQRPWLRAASSLLVVAALVLAVDVVVGDVALDKAPPSQYQASEARTASSALFWWPQGPASLGLYYSYRTVASHDPARISRFGREAIAADRSAVRRDPADPILWATLGGQDLALHELAEAQAAFEQSLSADPWTEKAFAGLASVALARHQFTRAERYLRVAMPLLPKGAARKSLRLELREAQREAAKAGGHHT